MANEDSDALLQHFISPRINPPPTLLPLPEHNDVDVAVPMLMTASELKDRLIFGPYPPSLLVDAHSQNPSPSSSDHSTVKPKSTVHGFNRSRSAPAMASINIPADSVDHVFHLPRPDSKSIVRQTVAMLIVYLSVMSVVTVVYGDQALKTLLGRVLAAIWLLVSTLAVARGFFQLAEARMDKRNRERANRVLGEKMSISQFYAADIESNGYLSLSDYVIYKLKEMEKINQEDIIMIANQFDKLDRTNRGKITLSDLLETSTNDLSTAASSL